jgi:hypothetical protein
MHCGPGVIADVPSSRSTAIASISRFESSQRDRFDASQETSALTVSTGLQGLEQAAGRIKP